MKTHRRRLRLFAALCYCGMALALAAAEADKPLTNADVVKMIKAELKDDTIVLAIQSKPSQFDTSPDALIALKKEGASQKVLDAILAGKPSSGTAAGAGPATGGRDPKETAGVTSLSFNDVFLVDGQSRKQIKQNPASTVTKPGMPPFVAPKSIDVLSGPQADTQIPNPAPTFELALPGSLKPNDLVILTKPAVKSDSREMEVYRFGFNARKALQKHNLPITLEPVNGDSLLGGRFTKFRAKPVEPLAPGEYVLIVLGRYYDFGVTGGK